MRAVNLMPRDERRTRLATGRLPLFAAAGGIVVVTAAAFFLASGASSTATEVRGEVAAVETAIATLPRPAETAVSQGAIAQERSDRTTALSAALATRTSLDRLLREVSYVLPRNAWLTKLEATAPVAEALPEGAAPPPQATATAAGVTIEGATYSHESVSAVLARLSLAPSLSGVRLTSTALVEPQPEETSVETPKGKKGKKGKKKVAKKPKSFVTFVVSASVSTGGS